MGNLKIMAALAALLASLAFVLGSPAHAVDLYSDDDSAASQGVYGTPWIGVAAGYTHRLDEVSLDTPHDDLDIATLGAGGGIAELSAGYDLYVSPRHSIGVFGAVSMDQVDEKHLDNHVTIEQDYVYLTGVRGCYGVTQNNLFCVGGGWSWTEADVTALNESESLNQDGPFAQAGLEHHLGGGAYVDTTVRYEWLDKTSYDIGHDSHIDVEGNRLTGLVGVKVKLR